MTGSPAGKVQVFTGTQWAVALSLIFAPLAAYAWAFWGQWSMTPTAWANFATYVTGTVAVAIGALGFYALLLTIKVQQDQLAHLTRESESRYFEEQLDRLLRTLGDVLKDTDIRRTSTGIVVAQGRDAFKNLFRHRFRRIYARYQRGDYLVDDRTAVRQSFDELYRRFGSDFGHYFRTLYHCVLLVHNQQRMSAHEKKRYFDLILCRMSKFELALLFYNCLGSIGERKFKVLIEEYGLLEHLDPTLLLSPSHRNFYGAGAGIGT
jgi:hypothetical protein